MKTARKKIKDVERGAALKAIKVTRIANLTLYIKAKTTFTLAPIWLARFTALWTDYITGLYFLHVPCTQPLPSRGTTSQGLSISHHLIFTCFCHIQPFISRGLAIHHLEYVGDGGCVVSINGWEIEVLEVCGWGTWLPLPYKHRAQSLQ